MRRFLQMQWFWGMHGLVLETSIWLLAESTRSQLIFCCILIVVLWSYTDDEWPHECGQSKQSKISRFGEFKMCTEEIRIAEITVTSCFQWFWWPLVRFLMVLELLQKSLLSNETWIAANQASDLMVIKGFGLFWAVLSQSHGNIFRSQVSTFLCEWSLLVKGFVIKSRFRTLLSTANTHFETQIP